MEAEMKFHECICAPMCGLSTGMAMAAVYIYLSSKNPPGHGSISPESGLAFLLVYTCLDTRIGSGSQSAFSLKER
jgi:hypothetical protein